MAHIKAPNLINQWRLFLAGSIEMGEAAPWQEEVANLFEGSSRVTVLNPRRDDWDSSWEQTITNPQFREQVNWELAMIEASDGVFMYFEPGTKSPITLLELGLLAHDKSKALLICCPDGFWRKGNVEVVCDFYDLELIDTYEEFLQTAEAIATVIKHDEAQ